jgi:hypothetical protein
MDHSTKESVKSDIQGTNAKTFSNMLFASHT